MVNSFMRYSFDAVLLAGRQIMPLTRNQKPKIENQKFKIISEEIESTRIKWIATILYIIIVYHHPFPMTEYWGIVVLQNEMQTRNKSLGMWHRMWLFFLLGTTNSRKIVGNVDHQWLGNGTRDNPYIVSWPAHDALNRRNYGTLRKVSIIALSGLSTLSVAFASSTYSI